MKWIALLLIWLPMTIFAKISADELQSEVFQWVSDSLESQDLLANTEILVKKIDSRVQLNDCDEIKFEKLNQNINNAKFVVRATCQSPQLWRVHVPVTLQYKAYVVTLLNTVQKGDLLFENDVILTEHNVNKLTSGFFEDTAEVLGKEATRTLTRGMIVQPNWVKEPIIVKRGEKVTLVANSMGIEVKSSGVALSDGRKGETIEFKNDRSNRKVFGKVLDKNTVAVEL